MLKTVKSTFVEDLDSVQNTVTFEVVAQDFVRWSGSSPIPTVRETFHVKSHEPDADDMQIHRWLCPQHRPGSFPRKNYMHFHYELTGEEKAPYTVEFAIEAMYEKWPKATRIICKKGQMQRYYDVLAVEYNIDG